MLLGAKVGQAPEAVLLPLWSFISSTSSLARVLGRLVEAQGPTAAQPCGKGCWWYTEAGKLLAKSSVQPLYTWECVTEEGLSACGPLTERIRCWN